ncbi:MAG: N-acetylmuramoyl-L-alanine amidase CwlA, partial [Bacteroidota bacterium]|nr:N-acetylmuramoyl-L-alanine amidase CwlA [Bacteroidota bacterium]
MGFTQKYAIEQKLLTTPSKRRGGALIHPAVKFVVAHDTGNPTSTADNNVTYFERSRDDMSASAHIFVDDKQIIECIPVFNNKPEKAWHVLYQVNTDNNLYGCNANDAAIGVEYCYGHNINADEAYSKYLWVLAYLCYYFKLDPAKS